jgi:AraC family transcriptional regulator, regulatory protein of adaptative response / methylated-DNA-[protein]-cysteine methyltransferase
VRERVAVLNYSPCWCLGGWSRMTVSTKSVSVERNTSLSDIRWAAVIARDKNADGEFFYSVRTTGVYCRPSCPSRAAKRENVTFYKTVAAAEAAGFRPCKRCKPNAAPLEDVHAAEVAKACRAIETAEQQPTLRQLAAEAGMSPFHFHRVFSAIAGITAKDYAQACRSKRVRDSLAKNGSSVTGAVFGSGYNSSGRFYAASDKILGMAPKSYKTGGQNVDLMFAVGACWLGSILVAATKRGVAAVLIGDDADALLRDLQDRFQNANLHGGDKAFDKLAGRVIAVLNGQAKPHNLPLDTQGTVFQHKVWQALTCIPVGATATYSEIAKRIGEPKSVRAVASACGANPVAVIVPCHRVVRRDGGISGYRWGIERKKAILGREAEYTQAKNGKSRMPRRGG